MSASFLGSVEGNMLRRRPRTWSSEQDTRLHTAVYRCKEGARRKWADIASAVGDDKDASSCYQRWNRVLDPSIDNSINKPQELLQIGLSVRLCGTHRWNKVGLSLGVRNDSYVRSRWTDVCYFADRMPAHFSLSFPYGTVPHSFSCGKCSRRPGL